MDNFLVFKKEVEPKKEEINLPDAILSYSHDSWSGYVKSTNDRKEDDFANYLKSICRG